MANPKATRFRIAAHVPIGPVANQSQLPMTVPRPRSSHQRRFWWGAVLVSPFVHTGRMASRALRMLRDFVPTLSSLWYYYAPVHCLHAFALFRRPRDLSFSFWRRLLRPSR